MATSIGLDRLIDARGRVRWEHAGEGDYDKMKEEIRSLLNETGTGVSRHFPSSTDGAKRSTAKTTQRVLSEAGPNPF